MIKNLLPCMVALSCVAFSAQAVNVWDGTADTDWLGDGTDNSPYLISSAEELAGLAKRANNDESFEGKFFKLTADIWLSDENTPAEERINWKPIASHDITNDDAETNPGGWYGTNYFFKGTFDGDGHTIHNLWFSGTTDFEDFNDPFGSGQIDFSAFNKALFGGLEDAVIKNLNVKNVNVGGAIVAGLAIEAINSTFTDVYIDGHVKSGDLTNGGNAAGLIKEARNCEFLRCQSNVNVYAFSSPAPFVSYLKGGSKVTDCKAGGTSTGCVYASGFIGSASAWEEGNNTSVPVIRNSSSSGLVTIIPGRNQGDYGAGFIGLNTGEIYNCFSTSDLHVTSDVGAGFCVDNRGHIESCYALGDLYNEEYGVSMSAFVSDNGLDAGWSEYYPGTVLNCYAAGSLTAPDAPTDIIATPTQLWGFCSWNNETAGSVMANCYFDSTKNPKLRGRFPTIGSFGVTTEYMRSQEFVDDMNAMAAVMGTTLWEYNPDGYPTCTDVKATDVSGLFAGGDGTAENPFLVSNKKELENLAYATNRNWAFRNQYIKQTADIELNPPFEMWGEEMPTEWTPIGDAIEAERGGVYHFCGSYDGDMHTVANLYIDNPDKVLCGLFGTLGKGAEIKNLGVTDAWMRCYSYSGILVGAARIHNEVDQFAGPSSISHCWTSGEIKMEKSDGFSPGGIIGYVPYNGDFTMNACYSTASAPKGLIGAGVYDETYINGCWYAGKGSLLYSTNYFWTFIDQTLNPSVLNNFDLFKMGRTTEYMQSSQFVNDLNFAAAYKGFDGGWCYNENNYPSFISGTEATVKVTLNDGYDNPLTFNVIPGSVISNPVTPEKEGEVCAGWYTDKEFTNLFEFGTTQVTEDIELYARWSTTVTPDVSIFKNKFATTFTIKTIEQLYGFASIVNGESTEVEKTDFTGKTIKLGADLILNDVSEFDSWGTNVTPVPFPCIGSTATDTSSDNGFNGTFDGQGYSITGLYIDESKGNYKGFFRKIGSDGTVKNLILKNACLTSKDRLVQAGLLAGVNDGIITRCGVDGKIIDNYTRTSSAIGGLVSEVGIYSMSGSNAELTECYADVDIVTYMSSVGGLFCQSLVDAKISDNFVRGSVHYKKNVYFGSVASTCRSSTFAKSYGAIALSWDETPIGSAQLNVGGAYYSNSGSESPIYYDKTLVSKAFNTLEPSYAVHAYANGIGLTTAKMKLMSSYEDFDFENVWGRRNDINDGYPYLRWTAPGLENDEDSFVPVESISLDHTNISGAEGESVQLTVTFNPENASDKTVEWSTSDEKVATVDETGLVTFRSPGTATITVSCNGFTATCEVTVVKTLVKVESILFGHESVSLKVDESANLDVEVIPADATQTLEWESSNPDVVEVKDGVVIALRVGTSVITARATDGSGVFATCTVEVESSNVGVSDIMIDSDSEVSVLSLQGQLIFKGKFSDLHLTSGIYIIRTAEGKTLKVRMK